MYLKVKIIGQGWGYKRPIIYGRLAGTLIHCVLLRKQTFSFSSVTVKNRVRVRVSFRVRVRVTVGFRA